MSLARREQRSRGNAVSGRETGADGLDPGPRAPCGRWAAPWGAGPGLRPQPRPPASPAVSLPVCLCPSSARRRMSVRLPSKPGARQASHQQRQSRVAGRAAGHQQAPCSPLPARKHAGALALRPPAARRGCWGVAGRLCRLSRGARPGCHHQSRKRQRQRQRWRGAQAEGAPVVRGWGVEGGLGEGPARGPPRCLSLQLALTHRGGCVSAQVAQALPAGTWVSHGEGPPGQQGTGSSSAQPGQEGRRPPPESSAAPSAAPAAQTLRPAPVAPSSLLSSRLSGAPLFPWVSGRPQGFLFVPAHPDLHTAVEDGGPASPGRFRHQGQAGGRPGRPPAGLQWAPSRPLLHLLSQTLPPRKPRPAQWSEPPRERPRQAPARPGPRRPPAGLQEPAVNSWWLRPPYSDSTDPRG